MAKNSYDYFKDVSLLVVGFDPYIDVWNSYFELLNKYWSNRPKTYLVTNGLVPKYTDVEVIPTNEKCEWSKKVTIALKEIKTKYVILLLEDFFTTTSVSNDKLEDLMVLIKKHQIKYCKLMEQGKFKGENFMNYSNLQIIAPYKEYGISLQAALWDRDFLSKLVGDGNYNAWLFEYNQLMKPTQNLNNSIDCVFENTNILQITHGVVQQKYLPKCIATFKKQRYEFDLSNREVFSFIENFKYRLKLFMSFYSPKCLKGFLKGIGKLLKVDFVSDRIIGSDKK